MEKKLQEISALSQFYGSDSNYVFLGGGNTSVKNSEFLYIKPSGTQLATIRPDQFLKMDRSVLRQCFSINPGMSADEREALVKDAMAAAVRPIGSGRPSVEAPVHEVIDYTYVVHLHPALVNGMTCSNDGAAACARLFPDALWLGYCDPGYTLANTVKNALQAAKEKTGAQPHVFFLQNHGVFVAADSAEEIKAIYADMIEKLSAAYKAAGLLEPEALPAADSAAVLEAAPALRTILAAENGDRAVVHCVGCGKAYAGPLTPDHIVYAKSFAYSGDATFAGIGEFQTARGYQPKVIEIPGKALFTAGATYKDALSTAIALDNARYVERLAGAFGGPHYMTPAQYGFIENWEVESYRRKVSSSGQANRLGNRVCLVTGGAQGFGFGIADYLAAAGGIIIIADMNLDGAKAAAATLCDKYGTNRAMAVAVNIADEESVEAMTAAVAAECGGVDLLVANAGVVRAGSVMEMAKKDFDFVTNINYTGYFLCVKYMSRLMDKQTVDGRGRWSDIVQVNSKSGLEGSNKNGAYAGSKFGTIGLTQSFAKELVANHIKVNSVCPGNYYDGPLWSDPVKGLFITYLNTGKVPGAKTVADVKEFYESKVPMHRGCTPPDVAKAIIYCVEQDYETGQAIPVTGGQVMLN